MLWACSSCVLDKVGDLGFQRAEQLQEFPPALLLDGLSAPNPGFDLSYGVLDHRVTLGSSTR